MIDTETRTQHELVESVAQMVRGLARRMHRGNFTLRNNCELADVEQRGFIGAIAAARRYTPADGHFAPFAAGWIRGQILNLARESDLVKIPKRLLLEKRETYQRVTPTPDAEQFDPPERDKRQLPTEAGAAVQDYLRRLPKRELLVVALYFGVDGRDPQQLKEIAPQLGVSVPMISLLLKRALARGRECADLRDLFRARTAAPGRRRQWGRIGRKGHKFRPAQSAA